MGINQHFLNCGLWPKACTTNHNYKPQEVTFELYQTCDWLHWPPQALKCIGEVSCKYWLLLLFLLEGIGNWSWNCLSAANMIYSDSYLLADNDAWNRRSLEWACDNVLYSVIIHLRALGFWFLVLFYACENLSLPLSHSVSIILMFDQR